MELEKIFTDQQTGKDFNRPRYQVLKEDVLRNCDELIITEVDHLGRNKSETLRELQYFRDHNIRAKIIELPTTLMDISKLDNTMAQMLMETVNNMLIELYAAMAQAEINLRRRDMVVCGRVSVTSMLRSIRSVRCVLSEGGTHDCINLIVLCKSCHSTIHAKRGGYWGNHRG